MTHRNLTLPAWLRGAVATLGLVAVLAGGTTLTAAAQGGGSAKSVRADWNSSTSDQCMSCVAKQ
ncbi:hypothetical protein [Kitasatospora sp. LaBMicrA B282]|uniref:hypothetical protein n=1 Tax=Kitasatospora sp. LaBMicrA B282 TaxID=3420949 RepID=UPI003D0F017D